MTMRFRRDLTAVSPDGRLTLEAKSPLNAAGQDQDERSFARLMGVGQWDFCYQMLETASRRIVWERRQGRGESEPSRVAVSDDGWSVIWIDGGRADLLAFSPSGSLALRIRMLPKWVPEGWTDSLFDRVTLMGSRLAGRTWTSASIHVTTAGIILPADTWHCFLSFKGERHFCWCTNPEPLVLNLDQGRLLSSTQTADHELMAALERERHVDR